MAIPLFVVATAASITSALLVLLDPVMALIADKRDARLVGFVVVLLVVMLVTCIDKFLVEPVRTINHRIYKPPSIFMAAFTC